MPSNDVVIFLSDLRTLPELRKSLLDHPSVSIFSTGDQQASPRSQSNKHKDSREDDTLIYEIDNKYYSATVSLRLLTLPVSPLGHPDGSRTLQEVISDAEMNRVFIWAFSAPITGEHEKSLGSQILPPQAILDILVDSQADRELNYALHLSTGTGSGFDSVKIEETFDELGWEYLVQSCNANPSAASGSQRQELKDASLEDRLADSDDWSKEEVEEQGVDVILAALQTVMWQGMRRKPKSTFGNPDPPYFERDTEVLAGSLMGNTGLASPRDSNGMPRDELQAERRKNVLAEDADLSKRMEDELEAWLNEDHDVPQPEMGSPSMQRRTSAEGFDDDFGPFESSLPSSALRAKTPPLVLENPEDELDFDLQVNLESILSRLNQTRDDLRGVDDEDERRVRAGREVDRILGMMGLDLGDGQGFDPDDGIFSP